MIQFTTRNRPNVLEYSLSKTREVYDGFIVVVDDHSQTRLFNREICTKYDAKLLYNEKRRGIPRSKERGFRSLKSYDYQFWFDDDCFPLEGWFERMEEAMETQGHLLHLKDWAHIKRKKVYPQGIVSYLSATACFMTFRKDMYESVRGFSKGWDFYGGWHAVLSQSMARYGVDKYVAVERSYDYIHSFDVDGVPPDFDYMFQSSLPQHERK